MYAQLIEDYIQENSNSVIRERGKNIFVSDYDVSLDLNSANAKVIGSQNDIYIIHVYNILQGTISSSCNCPYSYEGICKHEVAVLNLLVRYYNQYFNTNSGLPTLPKPTKSADSGKEIWIEYDTASIIRQGYSAESISPNNNSYSRNFEVTDIVQVAKQKNGFSISLSTYPSYNNGIVKIRVNKSIVKASCTCNIKNNQGQCSHLETGISYLITEHNQLLATHPEVAIILSEVNEIYGLDKKSKDNFSLFWNVNEGLYINFKEANFVHYNPEQQKFSIANNNGFAHLNTSIDSEDIYKQLLPQAKKVTRSKVVIGFAFLFDFYPTWREYEGLKLLFLKGNLLKNGTRFSSKIEPIKQHELVKELSATKELKELGSQFILLSETLDYDEIDSCSFDILQEIWKPMALNKAYYKDCFSQSDSYSRHDLKPLEIQIAPLIVSFDIQEKKSILTIVISLKTAGRTINLNQDYRLNNALLLQNEMLYRFETLEQYHVFIEYSNNLTFKISSKFKEDFFIEIIKPLEKIVEVNYHLKTSKTVKIDYKHHKIQMFISQYLDHVIIRPNLYITKDLEFDLLSPISSIFNDNTFHKRSLKEEQKIVSKFYKNNPDLTKKAVATIFALPFTAFIQDYWFLKQINLWKTQGIETFGLNTLENFNYRTSMPTVSHSVSSKTDWFDVQMEVKFDDELVPLKVLKKAVIKQQEYVLLSDGTKGILPKEWLDKFSKILRASHIGKNGLEISKLRFSALDLLFEETNPTQEILEYKEKILDLLANFDSLRPVKVSKKISATLRDYQRAGLNWLNFLDTFNIGGCLADDMGLGKTLQVIAFLQHLKEKKKKNQAHLVVLPTSLVYNWTAEIEKFCPSLKIHIHTGIKREKNTDTFQQYDLVITTYGLVIRDISFLKSYTFEYVILDESQSIKNPTSQRYKAVKLLKARNRLVLTGTPVENSLMDLYAQFNFINPGFLNTQTDFKDNYIKPIEKEGVEIIQNELRQLINPFMLRRTKKQVAKDLPEKVEQILYCSMGKKQEQLYQFYLAKIRKSIMEEVEEEGLNKSKLKVLAGLTKLRQLCNSPRLIGEDEEESVKIEELLTSIKEKTGDHKILIFSQFVKMLQLIEEQLKKEGIVYEYLDGQTKNRQERVDRFQSDPKIRVFLISLKAGGTGLNLTAADYVYIVDPWWNPAVENQAIDRTHRIGQHKNVTAYRMICKDTIEEKILKLQERKRKLSEDIIATDESFAKKITKKDLEELFS